jgi:endonuclease/exonuclease/phosphatase (EEP) superfamily protein YafD
MESSGLDYRVIRGRSDNLIFGTLVLARQTVDASSFGFAEGDGRAIALAYQPEGWPEQVKILSSHPVAPTSAERASLRDAQLGFAADWAAQQDGAYMVVGDLNASPWSSPFRGLVSDGGLRNSQLGFGLQPSFSANTIFPLRVPIDHLLHSQDLRVTDRRLGPPMGSDHFPLLVDLQYAPGP